MLFRYVLPVPHPQQSLTVIPLPQTLTQRHSPASQLVAVLSVPHPQQSLMSSPCLRHSLSVIPLPHSYSGSSPCLTRSSHSCHPPASVTQRHPPASQSLGVIPLPHPQQSLISSPCLRQSLMSSPCLRQSLSVIPLPHSYSGSSPCLTRRSEERRVGKEC